jgi:hypothetical protein
MTPTEDRSPTVVRTGAAALAAVLAEVGAWAAFAPRSFYDSFPGGGRTWVSADGPYNQHLVRDFGQMNLAFVALLVTAAIVANRTLVRAVLGAYLIPAVLHFVYHATHTGLYRTTDAVGNLTTLGLAVVIPAALIVLDVVSAQSPRARRATTS